MPDTLFKSGIIRKKIGFEYDGSSVIVDNSSSAHILSEEDMFTENIEPIISNGAATIGGKYLIPKRIGTVSWSWTYDEVQFHTNKLNNVSYLLDSPVDILSATALAESMKYD